MFDANMFMLIIFIIGTLGLSLKVGKTSMNVGISAQKLNCSTEAMTEKIASTVDCMVKKKVRLVVIFSLMMAVFLASFLPFAVGRLLYDAGFLERLSSVDQYKLLASCHLVYKSSSFFNPLLTLTLKDDYRERLINFFCRRSERDTVKVLVL